MPSLTNPQFSEVGAQWINSTLQLYATRLGGMFLSVLLIAGCSSGTDGDHITEIQTGTGFNQEKHTLEDESDSFEIGQKVHVVLTVESPDKSATVVIHILRDGIVQDSSLPMEVGKGDTVLEKTIELHEKGEFTITADYDTELEASTEITVE